LVKINNSPKEPHWLDFCCENINTKPDIMKKLALLFIISLAFISCEKEQYLFSWNKDVPLLRKEVIDGESYMEYSYTAANLISEEKSRFFYTKHTYDDENRLIKSEFYMDPAMFSSSSFVIEEAMKRKEWVNAGNTSKNLTKTYEYKDNGQLYRINFIRPSVNDSEYSEYTWENDRISRQSMYRKRLLNGYIDFLYDDRGNLIKATKYYVPASGFPELSTTNEFEYDYMGNPFQSFNGIMTPGKYTNPNNIVKETYTIHFEVGQSVQKVTIRTNSYRYNKDGYPEKVNDEVKYVYE